MKIYISIFLFLASSLIGCKIRKPTKSVRCETGEIMVKSTLNENNFSVIKGRVIDKVSGEILPFSKVVLTKEKIFFKGITTDMNGEFAINNVPSGKYEISINNTDYENVETTIYIEQPSTFNIEVHLLKHQIKIAKPVIYLYPLQPQTISVTLNFKGKLIHSYPSYPTSGWKVTAEPNGTLHDENGQEYYALYWEGIAGKEFTPQNGFIVSGKETAIFLEEKLAYLGLNRREANEFIMYWLPQLENNPYNLIHFSGIEYEREAVLTIKPQPETIIRFSMITQALQSSLNFPIQDLTSMKKVRKGFTVVEWGGCIINQLKTNSN